MSEVKMYDKYTKSKLEMTESKTRFNFSVDIKIMVKVQLKLMKKLEKKIKAHRF